MYRSFYELVPSPVEQQKFLLPLSDLIDQDSVVDLFIEKAEKPSRMGFDGAFTLIAEVRGEKVGIIYNDFKMNGGGFGEKNSERIVAFLNYLDLNRIPLVFSLQSIGVRFMEGRKVFKHAFKIIPALKKFKENNLIITCSTGQTLGIAALLYDFGDYRLGIKDESLINLTGPNVYKLFFGKGIDFEKISSAQNQLQITNMVNDYFYDRSAMFEHIRDIIAIQKGHEFTAKKTVFKLNLKKDVEKQQRNHIALNELLKKVQPDQSLIQEVMSKIDCSVKVYIVRTVLGYYGLFLNPPGNVNMICARTLQKYKMGLDLFKKLGLPIISLVNTSGGDPRVDQLDKDIISELNDVTAAIIDYPFAKLGIVNEKCYGGATVLSFPAIFGGEPSLILEGANLGVMHKSILEKLLDNSPRLLKIMKANMDKETPGYSDLIEEGLIQKKIELHELSSHIQLFMLKRIPLKNTESSESIAPLLQKTIGE